MSKFLWCLWSYLVLATSVFADERQDKHLLIGQTDHPQIALFSEIIKRSYHDIGYHVTFVRINNERRLISLNSGLIDAIVIGLPDVTNTFKNIVKVEQPIVDGSTYLICKKGVACDMTVFTDPQATIFVLKRDEQRLKDYIGETLNAKLSLFERIQLYNEFMRSGRADYGVISLAEGMMPPDLSLNFNYVEIYQVTAFHFVNKKHAHLNEALSVALRQNLELSGMLNP